MKKKILFVNGHLNVGGVEKSLVDLLKNIDYDLYDVDLLLFEGLGDYEKELPQEVNVIFYDITNTYGSIASVLTKAIRNRDWETLKSKLVLFMANKVNNQYLKYFKHLLPIQKEYDCAIAYRVGFCADIVAYAVNALKKICWWHHGVCNYGEDFKKNMNKTFLKMDKIVSVSQGCKQMIQENFCLDKDAVVVIPNMIDIDDVLEKSVLFDVHFTSRYNFVTVGRLSKEKHVDNVVSIAKQLVSNGLTDFTWYIIGDGQEYERIENLILENGLEKWIKMLGTKDNPYPYMKCSTLLVHTSLVESQCLTVLEAMALSIPCVVTNSLGPSEFIINYKNGILTSDDPKEIANCILDILANENLYYRVSENSNETVQCNYSNSKIIQMFNDLVGGTNE